MALAAARAPLCFVPRLRLLRARAAAMSNTLRPYLACIRTTLEAAMCLRNFPSQLVRAVAVAVAAARVAGVAARAAPAPPFPRRPPFRAQVERHNKPEVEDRGCKELLLNPLTICRR